jgi:trk system potassium uptake protein TrkH
MNTLLSKATARGIYLRLQRNSTPPRVIAASFILIILLGALLLMLPIAHRQNVSVSFLDALFTATSAVCVTGLVTLTTATTWTFFGQFVILCLIQIGGLSFVTIYTYLLVHLGKKVTLKDRLTIQATFNVNDMSGMVRMVIMAIRGTLIIEGIGAVSLFAFFLKQGYDFPTALFYGIFHSVSAFCNAGFDIIGKTSFVLFHNSLSLNLTVMFLIVLGGIGFSVWRDLRKKIAYKLSPTLKKRSTLSLHSKLAILTTICLLAFGTLYFFVSEFDNPNTLGPLSVPEKLLASMFESVTLRTAGFATFTQEGLKESSKLVASLFMLIGGSPGGTAGGIKTVTIAIVLCSVWSTIKGRRRITVFRRSIPTSTLQKALTVITIILILWLGGTVLLSITEQYSSFPHSFTDLLYEVASALGTVGLTTGITPHLSPAGKIIIMLCMLIGRIGPMATILSLSARSNRINERIQYPDEEVMIG